jgi:hypothetical protein
MRSNAYAERWVRTARAEVTDRMLNAGSRHLRVVLDEYVAHFNQHRPHRARNLRPPVCGDIVTAPVTDLATARIRRRKVLGGLIHEYERVAWATGPAITLQVRDHVKVWNPTVATRHRRSQDQAIFLAPDSIAATTRPAADTSGMRPRSATR